MHIYEKERPRGSFVINGKSEDNLENKQQKWNLVKESGEVCECFECAEARERETLFGQEKEDIGG